ncbi:nucleotidyltransferase family protein [Alsobacter sp. KACC 23698]|uniref:Nucleotidyltransferase family protein n=1 Tax=Alsobacter sp. KACC 23698 TaxID=3149229 RepID=A0AAU7JG41_9HYPH
MMAAGCAPAAIRMEGDMRPSAALASNRDAVISTVSGYPVSNLRVFGSVARGEDDENSDVDLLIDPLPGLTLFQICGLEIELERLLGKKVDLVIAEELHRRIKGRVLAEAKPL